MNDYFETNKIDINAIQSDSKKLNAFRQQFPFSETFYLNSIGVDEFLSEHSVGDGSTYGIMVGKVIVEDDDHLRGLLNGQDEIAIEFRHVGFAPGGRDEEVYQWLRHAQEGD
jgi:hypothetical protein